MRDRDETAADMATKLYAKAFELFRRDGFELLFKLKLNAISERHEAAPHVFPSSEQT